MDPLTELLAQLRNSKDENGSRYAVKRLAEMLKEDEGTAVQLMRASANLEEVFSLWDGGVSKVCELPDTYIKCILVTILELWVIADGIACIC
jgi:hypothetical protein